MCCLVSTIRSSVVWAAGLLWVAAATPVRGEPFTIVVTLPGESLEGTPLAWSDSEVRLLGRDGVLRSFRPSEAIDYRRTDSRFESYPAADLRNYLRREFGSRFEVSASGYYLVVHPVGQRQAWAPRFEQLRRSFVRYLTAHGGNPRAPQFPLIAVVLSQHEDFARRAAADGVSLMPGTLGYYSLSSNRVVLFDVTSVARGEDFDLLNDSTILHEATHQIAFNTGIHNRFAPPPRWFAEGLATVLESPAVWDARQVTNEQARANPRRLAAFLQHAAPHKLEARLASLVASDEMFRADPEEAYAISWALSFFLIETSPRAYFGYAGRTAARADFSEYSRAQRLADFTRFFGGDWGALEARLLRHMNGLR